MSPSRFLFASTFLFGAAVSGLAQLTVPNTGVDALGTPLTAGASDPHWSVISGSSGSFPRAATVVPEHANWAHPTDARWIWGVSPTGGGAGTQAQNTTFTFRLTFDLTGYDPLTAVLSGDWGADNNASLFLNGTAASGSGTLTLSNTTVANFDAANAASRWFSIASGFVSGINHFDVAVTNAAGTSGNPAGFYVSGLELLADPLATTLPPANSAVPEPATYALVGTTLLGLLALARRLRARSGTRA